LSARLQNESTLLIPSFYQMRPDIMEEVELGPLIGSGAMGRCYRGTWQVRQAGGLLQQQQQQRAWGRQVACVCWAPV
jgi:hypothetical protein